MASVHPLEISLSVLDPLQAPGVLGSLLKAKRGHGNKGGIKELSRWIGVPQAIIFCIPAYLVREVSDITRK